MEMKGAEAVLTKISILGIPSVEKFRAEKIYREKELDAIIRRSRTRREARLLSRAKHAGILCPVVYQVGEFYIRMKFLKGKMLHHELKNRNIRQGDIS